MTNKIPFFPNSEDNTHCFQSAIQMVLKHYFPNDSYTERQLEQLTGKFRGLWTWPHAGIMYLQSKGCDLIILDAFDYALFAKQGTDYLIDTYGSEIAYQQINNSKIDQEMTYVKQLLRTEVKFDKLPTLQKTRDLIEQGYLVIFNVNAQTLNGKEGYVGHFVVAYAIDDKYVHFHDPGLPPVPNRKETLEDFEAAWAATHDAYAVKYVAPSPKVKKQPPVLAPTN
jgi:hypothetical protein